MIGLYTKNNVLITKLVDNAVATLDVIEVKNRTLDGHWHIQTIGSAATILTAKVSLTLSEKSIVDTIKATGDTLKVVFDGKYYNGILDGEVGYDRFKLTDGPMFTTNFKLLVQEEGVI